jgi:hypothetical protein
MTDVQTGDLYKRLVDLLYSVPPHDRGRAHWVMSSEWQDEITSYAEAVLHAQPIPHPTELLGLPFVIDDAGGFPALVIPDI